VEERARRLRPVPDDYDQVLRLGRLRQAHPAIVVGAGNGWWQAVIPASDGEIVTTRYTLRPCSTDSMSCSARTRLTSRASAASQRLIRSRRP
jgi:hypothetical protein